MVSDEGFKNNIYIVKAAEEQISDWNPRSTQGCLANIFIKVKATS